MSLYGSTNCNPETGVRYGTIYLNSLDPDTADWLFTEGTNLSEEEVMEEIRAEVAADVDAEIEKGVIELEDRDDEITYRCDRAFENIQVDEPCIEGECDGVKYAISWLGGAPLLWVFFSPFKTLARLCSPCVPNAGDLNSLDPENGYECYDVPPDWRDKEER